MPEPSKAYTLKEVSQLAGVSVHTLQTYCKAGRILASRIGNGVASGSKQPRGRNEWRISREEIKRVFGV